MNDKKQNIELSRSTCLEITTRTHTRSSTHVIFVNKGDSSSNPIVGGHLCVIKILAAPPFIEQMKLKQNEK